MFTWTSQHSFDIVVFILWKWPISRENTANLKMSHFFVNSLIIYDHCKVYINTWFTNGIRHFTSFKSILFYFELVIFVGRMFLFYSHIRVDDLFFRYARVSDWNRWNVPFHRNKNNNFHCYLISNVFAIFFPVFVGETILLHLAPMACGRGGKYAWKGQCTMIESI